MKKVSLKLCTSLFAAGMVFMLAGKADAGMPRILSLGMDQETVWMIEKDEVYVNINPAYLGKLTPQLNVGYVGTVLTRPYGWLIFSPVDKVNLMITTGMPIDDTNFSAAPGTVDMDDKQFEFMGSYDLGSMILGVGTSFSYMKDELVPGTVDTNLLWTLNAGVLYTLSSSMSVDGGVLLNVWSADAESTGYDRDVVDFGFNGRFNWTLSEMNTLHIFFKYLYQDRDDNSTKNTYHNVTAGVSDEMHITKNSLVFAGFQYNMVDNAVPGNDTYTHTLKLVLGGEVEMFKVATARLGISRDIMTKVTTDPGDTVNDTENPAEAFFGLGLTFGNVTFDLNVSTPLITGGPQFVNGTGADWSTDFEAKYYFETGSETVNEPKKRRFRR